MTETFTCPHCELDHSIYQRVCEITNEEIVAPQRTTRLDTEPPPDAGGGTPSPDLARPGGAAHPADVPSGAGAVQRSDDPFGNRGSHGSVDPLGLSVFVSVGGFEAVLRPGATVVIGRESPDLAHPASLPDNISGRHATFRLDASGDVFVADRGSDGMGSTNGTYVNGRRLVPNVEHRLGPNDLIQLGQNPPTAVGVGRR